MLDSIKSLFVRLTFAGALSLPLIFASGCGGQGAGAGGGGATPSASTTAAKAVEMQMLLDTLNVTTAGNQKVVARVLVKNASNATVSGVGVLFSSKDSGVVISPRSEKTDDKGWVEAEITVVGRTNRSVQIVATASDAPSTTASGSFDVSGSKLSIAGAGSVVQGSTSTYTLTLVDVNGVAISGEAVTVRSLSGKTTLSVLGSGKTDAQGKATVQVVATSSGQETIEAIVAGAGTNQSIAIGSTEIVVTSALSDIPVNTPSTINLLVRSAGVPAANAVVSLAISRGSLSSSSVTTNANGQASVNVTSPLAGAVVVSASYQNSIGTFSGEFVSVTPATVSLQASPSVVGVNASSSSATPNSSQLIARVRDASGNPVKGVKVDFSLDADSSSGGVDLPTYAITDSSGNASIAFKPGPNPTGPDAIIARARVGSTITAITKLTASRQQLQIRMGSSNEVKEVKTPVTALVVRYQMPWTVVVTDSSGAPVSGATVVASLEPVSFRKGSWLGAGPPWNYSPTATCASEDGNNNGRLDAGEDVNGDGRLNPGQVASVYFEMAGATQFAVNGTTDAQGLAYALIDYPIGWAMWASYKLKLTATVTGTESFDSQTFLLPITTTAATAPIRPDSSPMGVGNSCANLN